MSTATRDREELVPLYSLEHEMSTLGSMLLSERAAEEMVVMLDEDDFFRPAHREIFKGMKRLIESGKPASDIELLKQNIRDKGKLEMVGGEEYLIEIAQFVPSPGNVHYYAGVVLDKATLRRLQSAGQGITGLVHSQDLNSAQIADQAAQLVYEATKKDLSSDVIHVSDLAKGFFVDVDMLLSSGKPALGITSGFPDLDKMTTGFYPGDMIIVGARPSMGKTALAIDFCLAAARENKGAVAFFSLEMSEKQVVSRMVSMLSGIPSQVLKQANITADTYRKLADACEVIYSLNMFVDRSSQITPLEMKAKCRKIQADHGLSMVVVDYLQLMSSTRRTENRTQEVSEIARGIKAIAKDLGVPIVCLSQLNRGVEAREDKRPHMSDLRESGSIEAEADIIMLLYRDAYYRAKEEQEPIDYNPENVEEAEVIIAKHRNGPTGKVTLGFQPAYARYRNLYHGQGR